MHTEISQWAGRHSGQEPSPTDSSTVAPVSGGRPSGLFSPTSSTLPHSWQFLSRAQLSLLVVCLLFLNHMLPPWSLNSNRRAKLGVCLGTYVCPHILRELRSFMKILWQWNGFFSLPTSVSDLTPPRHFMMYAKYLFPSKHSESSYSCHPESELSAVWSSKDPFSWALCNV